MSPSPPGPARLPGNYPVRYNATAAYNITALMTAKIRFMVNFKEVFDRLEMINVIEWLFPPNHVYYISAASFCSHVDVDSRFFARLPPCCYRHRMLLTVPLACSWLATPMATISFATTSARFWDK
jgi:hypothetical protein